MARKRWTPQQDPTPSLLKLREKKKWQIALRRYVLERNPCTFYAPYFGLDIENLRKWFEFQFEQGVGWGDFGEKWQFEHIIPVTYFDFSDDNELKLCWNFTNIRVEELEKDQNGGNRMDVLAARGYFEELYNKTLYTPCLKLLEKIARIEVSLQVSSEKQQAFINQHKDYLDLVENYSGFEFDLLNKGRSVADIKKEIELLKNFKQ